MDEVEMLAVSLVEFRRVRCGPEDLPIAVGRASEAELGKDWSIDLHGRPNQVRIVATALNTQRAPGIGKDAIVRRRPARGIRLKRPFESLLGLDDGARVGINFLRGGHAGQDNKKDAPR